MWTDGIVEDFYPGIESEIRLQDIEVESITVIDMLHGIEQKLSVDYDISGNIVIRGLMIKDYPLIIRLSGDIQFV